jgi:DNA ligase-1
MKRFVRLFNSLDQTTRTNLKVEALREYFATAPRRDAAWAAYLLAGKKIGKAISSRRLRDWVSQGTNLPAWLVEECFVAVGDLSETLALLLPDNPQSEEIPLHKVIEEFIVPLAKMTEDEQRRTIIEIWGRLDTQERFLFHKLISTAFRVGVSRNLLVRGLAQAAQIDEAIMAHRIAGSWKPTEKDFDSLFSGEDLCDDPARPYPFLLAHALQDDPAKLGDISKWQLEWKWDGIRAQLIRRCNQTIISSRGEASVATAFPELYALGSTLPDGTVLDGEILAWENDRPLSFAKLQTRFNRKNVEPMLFTDVPVTFLAYDLLELDGVDQREIPLGERRAKLETLASQISDLRLSPLVRASSWPEAVALMSESRARGVEGLMIKRRDSVYAVGRPRGLWWKLKVEPYTVDCVIVAAQPGHGKRAGLFTDYTFAVRKDDELVPIAKAYSGLTDEEVDEVDRWVRNHTTGKFGPVRAVEPELIFELGFEGIQRSDRHKSGIALRFPRMLRWRKDKKVSEIDTIETLESLLREHTS